MPHIHGAISFDACTATDALGYTLKSGKDECPELWDGFLFIQECPTPNSAIEYFVSQGELRYVSVDGVIQVQVRRKYSRAINRN